MRNTMLCAFALTVLSSPDSALSAQVLPSRNLSAVPLADTGSVIGAMARSHFSGEIMRGVGSAGEDRAWDATIGGFADLYRWGGGGALRARFAQEMLANTHNNINFKPRGIQFEENLSGVFHTRTFDWEAGLTYRCKHDIDNTESPTSSVMPTIDSMPQERVVVLAGLYGVISPAPIAFSPKVTLTGSARADYYVVHEDRRAPPSATGAGMFWSNIRGSAMLDARLDYAVSNRLTIYTVEWIAPVFAFGGTPRVNANERAEAGMHIPGTVGAIDLFVSYEHHFDDLSIPTPRMSNVVSVGMRVN
jgi:hypothetical protein